MNIPKIDDEGRCITAEFKEFVLVAVYVPNSKDGLERLEERVGVWDKELHNHLCRVKEKTKKPVILAGDLNVALHSMDVYDPIRMEGKACYTKEERNSF